MSIKNKKSNAALIIVWAKSVRQTMAIKKFMNIYNRMHRMMRKNTHPVAETIIKASNADGVKEFEEQNEEMENPKKEVKKTNVSRWFWGTFFLLILLSAFLEYKMSQQLGDSQGTKQHKQSEGLINAPKKIISTVDVSSKDNFKEHIKEFEKSILMMFDEGEKYYVSADDYIKFTEDLSDSFLKFELESIKEIQLKADAFVMEDIDSCRSYIEDYADWYYGFFGGYEQIGATAAGSVKELFISKLEEKVIGPCELHSKLYTSSERLDNWQKTRLSSISSKTVEIYRRWAKENNLVMKYSIDKDDTSLANIKSQVEINVSELSKPNFIGLIYETILRNFNNTVFKVGGAYVFYKVLMLKIIPNLLDTIAATAAFKALAKIIVKLLATLGTKTAGKGAAALAGAGTSTAACAWAGPYAIACGIVGGVVAWVSADVVVNTIDEMLNKGEFKEKINLALTETAGKISGEISDQGVEVIREYFRAINLKLKPASIN